MSVQNLRPITKPSRTPERAALATAISNAEEAKRAEASARDAVQRATHMVEQRAAKLEAVSADAVNVKDAQATRMAEAATKGTPLTADRPMRDARTREIDAQDDLDAARAALASVEAALADAEDVHRQAGERLNATVDAVMTPGALRLLAETETLQAQLVERRLALQYMMRNVLGDLDRRTVNDFWAALFCFPSWIYGASRTRLAILGAKRARPCGKTPTHRCRSEPMGARCVESTGRASIVLAAGICFRERRRTRPAIGASWFRWRASLHIGDIAMPDDTWPAAAADLRRTLARSGVNATIIERVLAAIAPAFAAIERDRGGVDAELLAVFVAVQADIYRRHVGGIGAHVIGALSIRNQKVSQNERKLH